MPHSRRVALVIVTGLVLFAAQPSPVLADKHPAEKQGVKSMSSDLPTTIRIFNASGKTVKVYWINFKGERELAATLKDGEALDRTTFLTHPWLITDESDEPWNLYYPDAEHRVIRVAAPAGEERDSPEAEEPAAPAASSRELEALAPFAGRFDSTVTVKIPDQAPLKGKGMAKGEWIHNGQFLRQTWSLEPSGKMPAMNGSAMMTYDPRQKVYRNWSFQSAGTVEENRGKWDPKTRTIIWTADNNAAGGTTVTKSTFDEKGDEKFSIVFKDGQGTVVTEVEGAATRRGK
jgi:von Hippel-Lindau disease tumor supressor